MKFYFTHLTPASAVSTPQAKPIQSMSDALLRFLLESIRNDVSTNCLEQLQKIINQIAHYTFIDTKQVCLLNTDINIMGNNGDGT